MPVTTLIVLARKWSEGGDIHTDILAPFDHLSGYPHEYLCGCPCRINRATDSSTRDVRGFTIFTEKIGLSINTLETCFTGYKVLQFVQCRCEELGQIS